MKNNTVTTAGKRLAVNVDDRRLRAPMRPGVGEGDARFQSETIDHHRGQLRGNGQVGQDRHASSALKRLVKPEHPALARYDPLSAAFAETHKNFVEQRILEFLRDKVALHAK